PHQPPRRRISRHPRLLQRRSHRPSPQRHDLALRPLRHPRRTPSQHPQTPRRHQPHHPPRNHLAGTIHRGLRFPRPLHGHRRLPPRRSHPHRRTHLQRIPRQRGRQLGQRLQTHGKIPLKHLRAGKSPLRRRSFTARPSHQNRPQRRTHRR